MIHSRSGTDVGAQSVDEFLLLRLLEDQIKVLGEPGTAFFIRVGIRNVAGQAEPLLLFRLLVVDGQRLLLESAFQRGRAVVNRFVFIGQPLVQRHILLFCQNDFFGVCLN